ncbi:cytochrome C [Desulfonema ishimotonii]|uniref:Cytochrome C n=1 Tax=Desulfonema ishimotonii TaxID=45657 RepID=A0A401FS54_9BACT|nr:cytochrome c3 family protein [Desulfonema ishimotonii]GBC59788.1 cytochrome C [Desulfonema ishimotonii]
MKLLELIQNSFKAFWANRVPIFWTGALIALVLGFLYFFYTPPATDIGPEQPIAFSHRLHAGIKKIDCRFCHPYVARSRFPGLPPVEKCLYCHNHIIANHPEIRKEHNYFDTGTPTPWRKANFLPEHVLFNHQRHIRRNFQCEKCHGQVEAMDRIRGERFKMGFCIRCHQENKGPMDCWLACHS